MAIEAAVGQSGLLHDRIDADAIEAVLAQQARCRLHDPLVAFRLTIQITIVILDDTCHLKFGRYPRVRGRTLLATGATGQLWGTALVQYDGRYAKDGDGRRPCLQPNFATD
jgi:hypothetical protein